MNKNKIITAGAIILFLFSLCLMPSCNPIGEEDIDKEGVAEAIVQETLTVINKLGGVVEVETLLIVEPIK